MELLRPSSLDELDGGAAVIHGGTEVVPLLRDGILAGRDARRRPRRRPARRRRTARSARARRSPSSRSTRRSRTRCARRAGSPRRRSSATWARSAATCCSRRAAGTGGSKYPCRLHGGDRCHAREGEHREHAIFANDFCASAHPSDIAAALLALGARVRTTRARARARRALPAAGRGRTATSSTLEPGELILELELPQVEASTYLKAMDRKRWSFPQVGVAAARVGGDVRIALAGVAPIPWLLDGRTGSTRRRRCRAPPGRSTVARALVARGALAAPRSR